MRLLVDEDVDGVMLTTPLRARFGTERVKRVQDVGQRGADDESNLAWCAEHRRVLLTNDRSTILQAVLARLAREQPVAGVIVLRPQPYDLILEELELILELVEQEDLEQRVVVYVPESGL